MKANRNSGFTLIELVIIIVVLGILAAVAVPKYQDWTATAKVAACKGALGGLRSGVAIFYANAAASGTVAWPTLVELNTVGTVMTGAMPKNPYVATANAPDSVVAGVYPDTAALARGGWAYEVASGRIWSQTSGGVSAQTW